MSLRKRHTVNGLDGGSVKYFGKWPFQRILGMQEVLSVVFSLANLAAHAHNLLKLRNACSPAVSAATGYATQSLWTMYALGSINAWWWSAVFHARDTYLTERFDYLSADISMLIGLYVSFVRTCRIHSAQAQLLLAVLLIGAAAWHFHYMLLVKFDYGFNVMVCVVVGVLQQCMWCTWAWRQQHPQKMQLFCFVVLINAALSLELLDFAPLAELLDAHASWHFCTVPLIYMWYRFILADVTWNVQLAPQQSATGKHQ